MGERGEGEGQDPRLPAHGQAATAPAGLRAGVARSACRSVAVTFGHSEPARVKPVWERRGVRVTGGPAI